MDEPEVPGGLKAVRAGPKLAGPAVAAEYGPPHPAASLLPPRFASANYCGIGKTQAPACLASWPVNAHGP